MLINQEWVLTAAPCVDKNKNGSDTKPIVYVGPEGVGKDGNSKVMIIDESNINASQPVVA